MSFKHQAVLKHQGRGLLGWAGEGQAGFWKNLALSSLCVCVYMFRLQGNEQFEDSHSFLILQTRL